MKNPFDKSFNSWTIEDFQDALKFTWAKEKEKEIQVSSISLDVTSHFTNDIVELERGELINELEFRKTESLVYWKQYEEDNSIQAEKWMMNKVTSIEAVTDCIDESINYWNYNSECGEISKSDEEYVRNLAIQFHKEFCYINASIILAMIMQN